jgi:hypothetical protein
MANEFKIKKGLIVTGASGGTVVDIQGSQGQLFSVTDDLSGSIFAVSDISGVPIFDVNSSGLSTFDGLVSGITPVNAANFVTKAYVDGSGGGTGPFLPLAGGTLSNPGNLTIEGTLTGTTASFNSGATNVVASFTSTDGIAGIKLQDSGGNVELSASGNTFQVQPAGGGAALSVTSTTATFTGDVGIGGVLPLSNGGSGATVLGVHDGVGSSWSITKYTNTTTGTAAADGSIFGIIGSDAYIYNYETNGGVIFGAASTERMRITSTGNVGIGTTSPNNETNRVSLELNDTWGGVFQNSVSGTPKSEWRWSTGGQTVFGSIVSEPLVLTTNNISRIFIEAGGNVGIGTTSPGANLDVAGTAPVIRITNTTDPLGNGTVGSFEFFTKDSSTGATRTVSSIVCDNNAGSSVPEGELVFKTSLGGGGSPIATEKMRIASDGNVGIGTTSPSVKLHIKGVANGTDGKLYITEDASNGSFFKYDGATNRGSLGGLSTGGEGIVADWSRDGSEVRFLTGNSERMRITSAGNVGIGTTNPQGKLEVSGTNPIIVLKDSGGATDKKYRYFQNNDNKLYFSRANDAFNSFSTDLVIDSSGNVGIGTTSPASKLNVGGNATGFSTAMQVWQDGETALSGDVGGKAATFFGTSGLSNSSIVNIYSTGVYTGQTGGEIGFGGKYASGGNVAQFAKIRSFKTNASNGGTNYGGGLELWTRPNGSAAVPRMTILGDGNVGIGETSPDTALDVVGGNADSVVDTLTLKNDSTGNSAGAGINFVVDGVNDVVTAAVYGQRTGSAYHQGSLKFLTKDSSGGGLLERMRIASDGNVGIGTVSPGAKLEVFGTGNSFRLDSAANGSKEILFRNVGTGTATIKTDGDLKLYTEDAGKNILFNTNGGEKMRIKADGNVGIGNTDPQQKLHIVSQDGANIILNSNTAAENNGIFMTESTAASPYTNGAYMHYDSTANAFKINTGTTSLSTKFTILRDSGNVGIGTDSPQRLLQVNENSASTSAIKISNTTTGAGVNDGFDLAVDSVGNAYVAQKESFPLIFLTSDTERMRINSSGNVGIGTDSPAYKTSVFQSGDYNGSEILLDLSIKDTVGGSYNGGTGAGISFSSSHWSVSPTEKVMGAIYGANTDGGSAANGYLSLRTRSSDVVTERMRITSTGNVGIGTTNPANGKLVIDSTANQIAIETGTAGDGRLNIGHFSNGTFIGTYGDDGGAADLIRFGTHSGDERMRITSGGQLLINATSSGYGTNNYGYNLGVRGTASQAFISIARSTQTLDTQGMIVGVDSNTGYLIMRDNLPIDFYNNNTFKMRIATNGNVGIGTTSPDYDLDVERTATTINNDPTIRVRNAWSGEGNNTGFSNRAEGLYSAGADTVITRIRSRFDTGANYGEVGTTTNHDFRFITNGGEKMRITAAGNLGIGTSTPLAKLDIQGTQGQLFSVTDDLSGSIFAVADISGVPIFDVNSSGVSYFDGNVGIGATSPTRKLSIEGTAYLRDNLAITVTDPGTNLRKDSEIYLQSKGNQSGTVRSSEWHLQTESDSVWGNSGFSISKGYDGGSAAEYVRITSGGNVGIGTTNPPQKLAVIGNISLGNYNGSDFSRSIGINDAAGAYGNGSSYIKFNELSGSGTSGTTKGAAIEFYNHLYAGNTNQTMIIQANGNVGIGTASPDHTLDVQGPDTDNAIIARFYSSEGSRGDFIIRNGSSTAPTTYIGTGGGSEELSIGTEDANAIYIDNQQRVGIGTTSPTYELDVVSAGDGLLSLTGSTKPVMRFMVGTSTVGTIQAQANTSLNVSAYGTSSLNLQTAGTAPRLTILTGGNVGIGVTNPATQLEIYNSNDQPATLRLSSTVSDGDALAAIISFSNDAGGGGVQGRIENIATEDDTTVFKFYTDNTSSPSMTLFDSGNMTIAGTLTQNSDVRLKENIKPIESALDKVKQMQGVEFNKINSGTKEIGVVAQEIEKIIPELVLEDKEGIKSVAYGNITAVLIEAIKEQQKQIEELKEQLNK